MEFDNSFEVPLPPAQAWAVLMHIQGIAPCMPGAELTEVIDATTYKGKIAVRLGPVALTFAGIVKFEEIDAANHTAKVKAQGSDAKGRGGAHAEASFRLEPIPDGSRVLVHTNLTLSGAVAQYGRGVGIIQSTAGALIQQFADCLKTRFVRPEEMTSDNAGAATKSTVMEPMSATAEPISGFSLLAKVLWDRIRALFGGRG
jgi:carbon monoxide dehydrogenase subunit G